MRDIFGTVAWVCAGLWNIELKNLVLILYATGNILGCSTYIPQLKLKLKETSYKYSTVLGEDGGGGIILNLSKSALLPSL